MYRIARGIVLDSFKYLKNRKLTKQSKVVFNSLADGWVTRLNKQPYHGGETPDAADFRV
jgi:hypothetical protein